MKEKIILGLAAFACLTSIIAFILYGIDKGKAIKRKWRIKEATLLAFGFFGAGIGGLLGMKVFHHKTKHWYFWVVNILGVIVYAVGFAAIFMLI